MGLVREWMTYRGGSLLSEYEFKGPQKAIEALSTTKATVRVIAGVNSIRIFLVKAISNYKSRNGLGSLLSEYRKMGYAFLLHPLRFLIYPLPKIQYEKTPYFSEGF